MSSLTGGEEHPKRPGDDHIEDSDQGEARDCDSKTILGAEDVARGLRRVAVNHKPLDDDDERKHGQDGHDQQCGSRDEAGCADRLVP